MTIQRRGKPAPRRRTGSAGNGPTAPPAITLHRILVCVKECEPDAVACRLGFLVVDRGVAYATPEDIGVLTRAALERVSAGRIVYGGTAGGAPGKRLRIGRADPEVGNGELGGKLIERQRLRDAVHRGHELREYEIGSHSALGLPDRGLPLALQLGVHLPPAEPLGIKGADGIAIVEAVVLIILIVADAAQQAIDVAEP